MSEITFEQYLALLVEEQDSAATPFEWLTILRKYDEIIRLLPDKAVLYHNRCTVLKPCETADEFRGWHTIYRC